VLSKHLPSWQAAFLCYYQPIPCFCVILHCPQLAAWWRNAWLAQFLTSRHVQMLRILFYTWQRNLMI